MGKKFATIITDDDQHRWDKNKFYGDFEYVISIVLAADKLIILGNINARVGQDSTS